MATTADFRNGLCFNYNGKIVKIIEFQHVKPGKGPAFVRTKLRNLENGKSHYQHVYSGRKNRNRSNRNEKLPVFV